jgi:hypothetical protein
MDELIVLYKKKEFVFKYHFKHDVKDRWTVLITSKKEGATIRAPYKKLTFRDDVSNFTKKLF